MEKEKQLVSVIVTAYNIEEYLPRCMESLVRQTCEPLEIILVDDGSTDKTAKICDDYEKRYQNIRVIHQKNSGPSAARNAGVRISRGEFIGYVDGDDWVEPDMYEKMREACVAADAQIAVCTYRQVGEGGEEIHPTGNVIPLMKEEAMEWYISGHEQYHIYHSVWSKLFKKSVIEEISFPEGHKSEDIMYTTWALSKAERCVFLDTPYYNYMMDRSTSIMNTYLHERRFGDEIPFWKEQIRYLDEIGMTEMSEKAYYQFCRRMLFYYIDFRDKKMKDSAEALGHMLKTEKEKIKEVYKKDFAAMGDRVRIKLFLASPVCYYRIVKLYDKVIIPLRQR